MIAALGCQTSAMTQELIQKSLETNGVSQVQWHGCLGLGKQFASFLTLSYAEEIRNGFLNLFGVVPVLIEVLAAQTLAALPRYSLFADLSMERDQALRFIADRTPPLREGARRETQSQSGV